MVGNSSADDDAINRQLLADESKERSDVGSSQHGHHQHGAHTSRGIFAQPHLITFCQQYFNNRIKVDTPLPDTVTPGATESFVSDIAQVSFLQMLRRWMRRLTTMRSKYSRTHLLLQRVFAVVTICGVLALAVSLLVTVSGSKTYCNVVIPTDAATCCTCVCNVNSSWCDDSAQAADGGTVPSSAFFSGANRVDQIFGSSGARVSSIYLVSLVFILVVLFAAIARGNWYMLLCVISALTLQTLRSFYLHYSDAQLFGGTFGFTNERNAIRMVCDCIAVFCCWLLAVLVPFLRAGFRTLQFQQFGALTTHQVTLRNYNVMFAVTLLDLQLSSVFYAQMLVLTSEDATAAVSGALLYLCDLLSLYLGYQYIRFERRMETIIALVSKMMLGISWFVLAVHYFECFDGFKARAVYLRYMIEKSSYLAVETASAELYLEGQCHLSPAVSSNGDLFIVFASIVIAFTARLFSVFYAALLTVDFGKDVVSSLFFDVVAAKQKTAKPLVAHGDDTIDINVDH